MGEVIVVFFIALGSLFFIPYAVLRVESKSNHQGVFQTYPIPKCLNTAFFFPQSQQTQTHSVFGLVAMGMTWIFLLVMIGFMFYSAIDQSPQVHYRGAIVAMMAMAYSAVIHLFELAFTWIQEMYKANKVGDE